MRPETIHQFTPTLDLFCNWRFERPSRSCEKPNHVAGRSDFDFHWIFASSAHTHYSDMFWRHQGGNKRSEFCWSNYAESCQFYLQYGKTWNPTHDVVHLGLMKQSFRTRCGLSLVNSDISPSWITLGESLYLQSKFRSIFYHLTPEFTVVLHGSASYHHIMNKKHDPLHPSPSALHFCCVPQGRPLLWHWLQELPVLISSVSRKAIGLTGHLFGNCL